MAVPKNTDRDALEHIAEAYANYRRYERFLNDPEEVSWAVVALFYSAVHLMQAYAHAKTPMNMPDTHEKRAVYISNQMRPIASHYRRLRTASEWARYDMRPSDAAQTRRIHDADFKQILIYMREQGLWWDVSPSSDANT